MITPHTPEAIDIDIEVIKAQIQINKTKKAERIEKRKERPLVQNLFILGENI